MNDLACDIVQGVKTLFELAQQFDKKQLQLSGGVNVCYRVANPGATRPILVVHGLTGTHYSMLQMAGVWAERGDYVIAVDLPGHGESDEISIDTLDDVAVWLNDVIQQLLPDDDFVLVGNSFGCSVCVSYVRKYGLRGDSRMILTAPIPTINRVFQKLERLTAGVNNKIARKLYYCNRLLEPLRIDVLLGDGKNKQLRERVSESIRSEGYLVNHRYAFMKLMPANYNAQPLSASLPDDIAMRTLSFSGAKDRIAPKDVHERMQQLVGASQVRKIDNCGHLVHIEGIEAVSGVV